MLINRDSAEPLYRQLYHILRRQIEDRQLTAGQALPTEKQLRAQYKLSRVTIRKTLQLLSDEGLIIRQPGKGTYVAPTLLQENLSSLFGFAELMRAQYPDHVMEVLAFEVHAANETLQNTLGLSAGEQVLKISRRHMLNDQPLAYAVIYLPYALGHDLTLQEVSTTPVYTLLTQKLKTQIKRALQTVCAVAAEEHVAMQLDVELGSPVLLVKRVTYSVQEQPIEYIELYYPGERHELLMELQRDVILMQPDRASTLFS